MVSTGHRPDVTVGRVVRRLGVKALPSQPWMQWTGLAMLDVPDPPPHGHHHQTSATWPASRGARAALIAGALVIVILHVAGIFTNVFGVDTALAVALLGGFPLAARAMNALFRRDISYDVTITLAAGVAVAGGEFFAAPEVVLIVLLGDPPGHWA